jgi:ferredoxin-like protein FixX
MRAALAVAAFGVAAALLPVAPASAYCLEVEGYGCLNACPAGTYNALDARLDDALPDRTWHCLA